jgi:hypothetical protein
MRESKSKFFYKLNQAATKEFWKTLKLLNHNHGSSTIPTLEDRGTSIDSSIDKHREKIKITILGMRLGFN